MYNTIIRYMVWIFCAYMWILDDITTNSLLDLIKLVTQVDLTKSNLSNNF